MGDELSQISGKIDQVLQLCSGHSTQLSVIQATLTTHGKKLDEHDKSINELQQQMATLANGDPPPGLKRARLSPGSASSASTGPSSEDSARATRRERTVVVNGWPEGTARQQVQEFLRKHVSADVLVLSGFTYPTEMHLVFPTAAIAKKFVVEHNKASTALQWQSESGTRRLYCKKKPDEKEQSVGYVGRQLADLFAKRIERDFEIDKKKAHVWTDGKKLAAFYNGEKLVFTRHWPGDEPQLQEMEEIVRSAQRG